MRNALKILCAICMIFLWSSFQLGNKFTSRAKHFPNDTALKVSNCDSALWKYVYHSNRFQVYDYCTTVSGKVKTVRSEKDGDIHIQLLLDNQYSYMLNDKNYSGEDGCLVVEIICAKEVTQSDAIGPCSGYYNNVVEPHAGDNITVTGSYVLDKEHGWNEIHPVSALTINSKGISAEIEKNPVVGQTKNGRPIYQGPRGGRYHYSASGNKVYEKK